MNWDDVAQTGTRFTAQNSHQVVVHNNQLWVIGDRNIWWSQEGETWERVTTNNAGFLSRSRGRHQVVAHNHGLWVIGGDDGGPKNDVWWSQDGETWTEATNSANFSPREGHQVVVHNNRLWLIGGWNDVDGRKNDVWRSEDGENWRLGFHHVFQFH